MTDKCGEVNVMLPLLLGVVQLRQKMDRLRSSATEDSGTTIRIVGIVGKCDHSQRKSIEYGRHMMQPMKGGDKIKEASPSRNPPLF